MESIPDGQKETANPVEGSAASEENGTVNSMTDALHDVKKIVETEENFRASIALNARAATQDIAAGKLSAPKPFQDLKQAIVSKGRKPYWFAHDFKRIVTAACHSNDYHNALEVACDKAKGNAGMDGSAAAEAFLSEQHEGVDPDLHAIAAEVVEMVGDHRGWKVGHDADAEEIERVTNLLVGEVVTNKTSAAEAIAEVEKMIRESGRDHDIDPQFLFNYPIAACGQDLASQVRAGTIDQEEAAKRFERFLTKCEAKPPEYVKQASKAIEEAVAAHEAARIVTEALENSATIAQAEDRVAESLAHAISQCQSVYRDRSKVDPNAPKLPDTIKGAPARMAGFKPANEFDRMPWLYGNIMCRGYVTVTAGEGGSGKSALVTAEAMAMRAGKDIMGEDVPHKSNILFFNGEDSTDHMQRNFTGVGEAHGLGDEIFQDGIFDFFSGHDNELVIASSLRDGVTINEPMVESVIEHCLSNKIDAIFLDPLVSTHMVNENDNMAINAVIKKWAQIANKANVGVHIVHHVRKLNGGEATADSTRGGSSVNAAARLVRMVNTMNWNESQEFGIRNPFEYFRTDVGKANLIKRTGKSKWFQIQGMPMRNSRAGDGDFMKAAVSWEPPTVFDGITIQNLIAIQNAISAGEWRADMLQAADKLRNLRADDGTRAPLSKPGPGQTLPAITLPDLPRIGQEIGDRIGAAFKKTQGSNQDLIKALAPLAADRLKSLPPIIQQGVGDRVHRPRFDGPVPTPLAKPDAQLVPQDLSVILSAIGSMTASVATFSQRVENAALGTAPEAQGQTLQPLEPVIGGAIEQIDLMSFFQQAPTGNIAATVVDPVKLDPNTKASVDVSIKVEGPGQVTGVNTRATGHFSPAQLGIYRDDMGNDRPADHLPMAL